MANARSRYEAVSRRAFLARSLALGAAVLVPGLACGSSDSDVLGVERAPTTTSAASAPAGGGTTPTTTAPTTTAAPTSAAPTTAAPTTAAPTTAAPTTAPAAATATGQLTVDFTFAAAGGRVRNPFVAVWVEDSSGAMVQTVALWFEAGKGMRWLPDMRRWYQAAGASMDAAIATVSSATRAPGSYSVIWDGTDLDGRHVAAGTYFICIEAAREHGPYELIREEFTMGSGSFSQPLPANGELTAAAIALSA